ncbi:hypothetical protein [Streptomyces reniochalinae]|uniref:Uncharacterized protein n=1 Tax=Streptomyces reniochalinae TaxID=2250578 RepID=A0A367F617_9ACTN|nr:hypothetical protein [Streptomyces reniochalinae]RCG25711.1 hypothetical protein DQ392_00190 [Streptomyces reniochalinae]
MTRGSRGLMLYARSRSIPATLLVFLAAACLAWTGYLTDDPATAHRIGLIAVVLGVAAVPRTLAGPDEELERATALPWRLVRTLHLTLLAGLLLSLLAADHLITARQSHTVPFDNLAQAVPALTASTALSAACFGARTAWMPSVGWGLLMIAVGPRISLGGQALTWMVQEPPTVTSATTAALLTVVGVAAYARRGSRL